jgi:hypothetical protein
MKHLLRSLAVLVLLSAQTAHARGPAGDYICTVEQKAGIGALHLEGSGPPRAFVANKPRTRFAIRISPPTAKERRYRMVERPYSGRDRDRHVWHTPNAVLHSAYLSADGEAFVAVEDQAFLQLSPVSSGSFHFYHAGFEYPGGVDANLSVRWGTCVLQK